MWDVGFWFDSLCMKMHAILRINWKWYRLFLSFYHLNTIFYFNNRWGRCLMMITWCTWYQDMWSFGKIPHFPLVGISFHVCINLTPQPPTNTVWLLNSSTNDEPAQAQGRIIHKVMLASGARGHQPLTTSGGGTTWNKHYIFFLKLLYYSLEIVEKQFITCLWILISQK